MVLSPDDLLCWIWICYTRLSHERPPPPLTSNVSIILLSHHSVQLCVKVIRARAVWLCKYLQPPCKVRNLSPQPTSRKVSVTRSVYKLHGLSLLQVLAKIFCSDNATPAKGYGLGRILKGLLAGWALPSVHIHIAVDCKSSRFQILARVEKNLL